jgi:hypothetical protein
MRSTAVVISSSSISNRRGRGDRRAVAVCPALSCRSRLPELLNNDAIRAAWILIPPRKGGSLAATWSELASENLNSALGAQNSRFRLHVSGIHVQDFPMVPVEVEEAA